VRDKEHVRLEVRREFIADCTARKLTREDWKHREALRAVVARDLRAQVGVR